MKNKKKCPRCNSNEVRIIDHMGIICIVCNNCEYDESKQYEVYPEDKKSQKVKNRYTPYKVGGFGRVKKQK